MQSPLKLRFLPAAMGVVALVLLLWVAVIVGLPRLAPGQANAGNYVSQIFEDVPHPFTFERPRLWDDETQELHRGGEPWDVLLVGPRAQGGTKYVTLSIIIRPTEPRHDEYPVPGGPFKSMQDFVQRLLPNRHEVTHDSEIVVAGRQARDLTYSYLFSAGPPHAEIRNVPSRGRAAFFEDRGYFYKLEYSAAEADYERYLEAFERLVSTFKFLD